MRTSTAVLQAALAAQPQLKRLRIVSTADVEVVAPGTDNAYRPRAHWQFADFDVTGPSLASIETLALGGNGAWVNDEVLARIAALCPNLVCLDASACTLVTDAGVTAVIKSCSQLEALNLNGCENVTDYSLMMFCQRAGPGVARVCASGTQVSGPGLQRLLQQAPRLRVLELRGCTFDPEVRVTHERRVQHTFAGLVCFGYRGEGVCFLGPR